MLRIIEKSIIFRMGALMVALVTLALASMLSSYFIADKAERDAEAVNLSGSLRMQSYRILASIIAVDQADPTALSSLPNSTDSIRQSLDLLEQRLTSPILQAEAVEVSDSILSSHYFSMREQWHREIRPKLEMHLERESILTIEDLSALLGSFVDDLDKMVQLYQSQAEGRVANLRFVQILALFATLGLVILSLYILHHNVEVPLRLLTHTARRIGKGDFSSKVEISNQDELGLLARTINQMSADLAHMYATLETQVAQKTRELQQRAESLSFLYQVARQVSETELNTEQLQAWLQKLERITTVTDIDLCLKTAEASVPYEHIRSDYLKPLAERCNEQACVTCMDKENGSCIEEKQILLKYPLLKENTTFGVMVCATESDTSLQDWQHQVLQSFADQVAVSLSMRTQADQDRRVALMNERNVIARELHDSLAQALSYLKIQVTRLNRQLNKSGVHDEKLEEITLEIKEGITSAYRQLRELLTTFRLSVSEKGLHAAIAYTVEQVQEQNPSIRIELDYQTGDIPFSPHEEIHLLQLTREAIQNAARHSQGKHIEVNFSPLKDKRVKLCIRDDGIGIPKDPEKLNHYGMAIMRERSRNLNGELSIIKRPQGGTKVCFEFVPDFAKDKQLTPQV